MFIGENFFKVRNYDKIQKRSFLPKVTEWAKLTTGAVFCLRCTLLLYIKKWLFSRKRRKKWLFKTHNSLKISMLKVVFNKRSLVTCHFSINFSRKKFMLIYKLLIINILYTYSFFLTSKSLKKWLVTKWLFPCEYSLTYVLIYRSFFATLFASLLGLKSIVFIEVVNKFEWGFVINNPCKKVTY